MGALLFAWPELALMVLFGVVLPAIFIPLLTLAIVVGIVINIAGWVLERLDLI